MFCVCRIWSELSVVGIFSVDQDRPTFKVSGHSYEANARKPTGHHVAWPRVHGHLLSGYFTEPPSAIYVMLCTLAEEGPVRLTSKSPRVMQFRRADATHPVGVEPQETTEPSVRTVATFPVTRTFSDILS